jgi:hypothetical protein
MKAPFIVIDTKTGFHLASNNLKAVKAQTNNNAALAVLCNSILLLWKSVADVPDGEPCSDSQCAFVIDTSGEAAGSFPVQYFQLKDEVLCVVFGTKRHCLYEVFAVLIVDHVRAEGSKTLKELSTLNRIKGEAVKSAFEKCCLKEGITKAAVLVKKSTFYFSACVGELADALPVFQMYLSSHIASGVYCAGGLSWMVATSGSTRYVVVAYGAALGSFDRLVQDELLFNSALTLCLEST